MPDPYGNRAAAVHAASWLQGGANEASVIQSLLSRFATMTPEQAEHYVGVGQQINAQAEAMRLLGPSGSLYSAMKHWHGGIGGGGLIRVDSIARIEILDREGNVVRVWNPTLTVHVDPSTTKQQYENLVGAMLATYMERYGTERAEISQWFSFVL